MSTAFTRLMTKFLSVLLVTTFPALAQNSSEETQLTWLAGEVTINTGTTRQVLTSSSSIDMHGAYFVVTSEKSGAKVVYKRSGKVVTIDPNSEIKVGGSDRRDGPGSLFLRRGQAFFFGTRSDIQWTFSTTHVNGAVERTEFEVRIAPDGSSTEIVVYDGLVKIQDAFGKGEVRPGEIAVIDGQAPPRVTAIESVNEVQWWLHYPAILDLEEAGLSPNEEIAFSAAVSAWRRGNVGAAFQALPPLPQDASKALQIFSAAVKLGGGDVGGALEGLDRLPPSPIVDGHRMVIAAVKKMPVMSITGSTNVASLLGASYIQQSRYQLDQALNSAKRATELRPHSGLAWARRAELEFSMGHRHAATQALRRTLELVNEYAPAYVLQGFILAAENNTKGARRSFEEAIRLDPRLAEGWLGLGLVKFREGEPKDGLGMLRTATALQVNRSLLHSYLGKGYSDAGDPARASAELERAIRADENDPTPWLYSALEHYTQNRVNESIRDLQESLARNDNRRVYRSRLMLDQDRAVRATSLARVFQRAGLDEPALREAVRAVDDDYANPSAHLFLADSYNGLRDPTRFNLRYESAWLNELLMANLLAPVDAGIQSPSLSQNEYTRLFARDGFRFASFGEARSDGQFRQLATQSGVWQGTAYAVDLDFQHNDGVRRNNHLSRTEVNAQFKHQLTPQDTVMLQVEVQDYSSGDNYQRRDPAQTDPDLRYKEKQTPITLGFWRHEWSPGIQTLAMAGRLEDSQLIADQSRAITFYLPNGGGAIPNAKTQANLTYQGSMEAYVGELNQIAQTDLQTLVAGLRYQSGYFETTATLDGNTDWAEVFHHPASSGLLNRSSAREPFNRLVGYVYETMRPMERLSVTAGIAWEDLGAPLNLRHPPIDAGSMQRSGFLPKTALVWRPLNALTVRGMWARSLGGVSIDESYRLEPSQLAGFSQFHRSVMPESITGSVHGHWTETLGSAVDLAIGHQTFLGVEYRHLHSQVNRQIGVLELDPYTFEGTTRQFAEDLRFEEHSAGFTVHRLLGEHLALGCGYDYRRSGLERVLMAASQRERLDADLHSFRVQAVLNWKTGVFLRGKATWWLQSDIDSGVRYATDHQNVDLDMGWRFPGQCGEISVGVLNLMGDDYRLAPLSAVHEMPRERVFFARLRLNF